MNFKLGDVVQLKSGSPSMTIVEIFNNHTMASCTWYDFSTHTWNRENAFPVIALQLVSPQEQTH
ncbi:YodC family protein [Chryseobacterium sp. CT-SW4]|uniref:YodC family protein n=1 Tax=Chryseobacterium sp. SW-1 TaxID=3157343 RepID=UPI003B017F9C